MKQTLQLTAGVINRVNLQFPSGVLALAHVYVTDGLHQLWPANAESDFASSNETIQWDEELAVTQPPYQLFAYAFNTDTANPHTITIRIFLAAQRTVQDLAAQIAALVSNQPAAPGA